MRRDRMRSSKALLALAAVLPGTVHSAGHSGQSLAVLENGVLAQLNVIRASHGLKPLKLNRELSAAARNHTYDMIAAGFPPGAATKEEA